MNAYTNSTVAELATLNPSNSWLNSNRITESVEDITAVIPSNIALCNLSLEPGFPVLTKLVEIVPKQSSYSSKKKFYSCKKKFLKQESLC